MKNKNKLIAFFTIVAIISVHAATQIRIGQIAASGTPSSSTYLRGDGSWATPSSGSLSDADYGDITVSSSGTIWDIDAGAVGNAEVANGVAATKIGANTDVSNTEYGYLDGVTSAIQTQITAKLTTTKYICRETPSGSINGSNTSFTLANTPVAGTEMVYLNGILQDPGGSDDYTISGATITYVIAPATGDRIVVTYISQ